MTPAASLLDDAGLGAILFAIDPVGLGGVALRAGPGPARDAWTAGLRAMLPAEAPVGRAPLGVADDRLLGGLDLSASLAAGRPVVERGILAANDGGVVMMPMAERIEPGVAARVAAVLDAGEVAVERDGLTARLTARIGLVLFDEGLEPEERPPEPLCERLAFCVTLDARWCGDGANRDAAEAARAALPRVRPPSAEVLEALCAAAAAFGLESMRPPLLALRAARAHAALHGRTEIGEPDVTVAARLVLVPRALTLPADAAPDAETPPPEPPPPDPQDGDVSDGPSQDVEPSEADLVLAAVRAALPDDLLERIVADNRRAARAPRRGGAGAAAKSARRGRPAGSRPGMLRPGDRLNVPETLRAAAPWQALRSGAPIGGAGRVKVRPEDFRIRRFVQRRESTTVFVVDASGSAAFQRLAEAKGAVELLLAKAYVSRARVALVAFRATGAEVLLPPTRSLARARRSLADLPGGGGTPLASGLDAALDLALAERAKERTPLIVVLTDGRANVARDGAGGRAGAERDALAAAARIGEAGIGAAFLDTSPRPQPGGDRFARAMNAVYAPLPYADAGAVSAVVEGLREGRRA